MPFKIGITPVKYFLENNCGQSTGAAGFKTRLSYAESVLSAAKLAGVDVVTFVIPPDLESIDGYANSLDGVLFTGGDLDIHPALYSRGMLSLNGDFPKDLGLSEEEELAIIEKHGIKPQDVDLTGRVEFEFELFKKFFSLGKPVLGICFGMELMNVSAGGTLLPVDACCGVSAAGSVVPSFSCDCGCSFACCCRCRASISPALQDVKHFESCFYGDAVSIFHEVNFVADGLSAKFLSQEVLDGLRRKGTAPHIFGRSLVNSAHIHCVDRCGEGFVPVGFSSDGSVEAIVHKEHPFAIGVQWHPELMMFAPKSVVNANKELADGEFLRYDPLFSFVSSLSGSAF